MIYFLHHTSFPNTFFCLDRIYVSFIRRLCIVYYASSKRISCVGIEKVLLTFSFESGSMPTPLAKQGNSDCYYYDCIGLPLTYISQPTFTIAASNDLRKMFCSGIKDVLIHYVTILMSLKTLRLFFNLVLKSFSSS